MPSLAAIFLAGFHFGVDFGLWWAYPNTLPIGSIAAIEMLAALAELYLMLKLGKGAAGRELSSWVSSDVLQRTLAILIGCWILVGLLIRFLHIGLPVHCRWPRL